MGKIIGIDLGTTNSVAAYMSRRRPKLIPDSRSSGSYLTPSVVLSERGQRWIGQPARDRSPGSRNRIYSIKRLMGIDYTNAKVQKALESVNYSSRPGMNGEAEVLLDGEYYTPTQISAMILGQIKQNAELALGETVTDAVITVPAYFNQRQKEATREAGKLAGLRVARILNEPTAAALAFGMEMDEDESQQVLVYDLGGGTFDVSIMLISQNTFDVFNYDGDNFLGGDNFDALIMEKMFAHLQQKYRIDLRQSYAVKDHLKQIAEQAKIALSHEPQTQLFAEQIDTINGAPINLDLTLARSEFEAMISPLVERSLEIVIRALRGAHLAVVDIERVLLVGGSTYIPLVRRRLRELFQDRIELDVDPMQCVALGAAVMANMITESESESEILHEKVQHLENPDHSPLPSTSSPSSGIDILSKHLGIEVEDNKVTEGSRLSIIVEKQTPFPTQDSHRKELYTREPNQKLYILPIYEVEAVTPQEAEAVPKSEWDHVGVVENNKLPPGLPVHTPVMVEVRIDQDGILTVSSYLKESRESTYVECSFRFIGAAGSTTKGRDQGEDAENKDKLEFYQIFYDLISTDPALTRHLNRGQAEELQALTTKIEQTLLNGNAESIKSMLAQATSVRSTLPVPTEAVFWAKVFQDSGTYIQQQNIRQSLYAMEQAIAQNQIERANHHLTQLRHALDEVADTNSESSKLLRDRRW